MGQVCSGTKAEAKKASGFQGVGSDDLLDDALSDSQHRLASLDQQLQQQEDPADLTRTNYEEGEQQKKLREEQGRLDMIVAMAGRGMVAVRSTRGSTGYYDQGFAAALAQHLEQTTQFPETLPVKLPKPSTEDTIYNRLNQPLSLNLPTKVGEDPHRYMDNVAESLIETVVPAKQQLFARANPIVENLL
eukprot:scaffold2499_cov125-Cylindrotheca_fusiformis.AAC.31